MNQLEAMRRTVALMNDRQVTLASQFDESDHDHWERLSEDLKPRHQREMLAKMESGINPQDTERGFSEGKMGRWLGWTQAAVVAMGLATLDDMKTINKECSDDR